MSDKKAISGTEDAWDSRQLGADIDHVRVASPEITAEIEEAIGMKAISIRLDADLIESFKLIGRFHGIGYQPLMRDALRRFVAAEMKAIVTGVVESQRDTHPNGLSKQAKEKKAA